MGVSSLLDSRGSWGQAQVIRLDKTLNPLSHLTSLGGLELTL